MKTTVVKILNPGDVGPARFIARCTECRWHGPACVYLTTCETDGEDHVRKFRHSVEIIEEEE